jgi:hypothetical protein
MLGVWPALQTPRAVPLPHGLLREPDAVPILLIHQVDRADTSSWALKKPSDSDTPRRRTGCSFAPAQERPLTRANGSPVTPAATRSQSKKMSSSSTTWMGNHRCSIRRSF